MGGAALLGTGANHRSNSQPRTRLLFLSLLPFSSPSMPPREPPPSLPSPLPLGPSRPSVRKSRNCFRRSRKSVLWQFRTQHVITRQNGVTIDHKSRHSCHTCHRSRFSTIQAIFARHRSRHRSSQVSPPNTGWQVTFCRSEVDGIQQVGLQIVWPGRLFLWLVLPRARHGA